MGGFFEGCSAGSRLTDKRDPVCLSGGGCRAWPKKISAPVACKERRTRGLLLEIAECGRNSLIFNADIRHPH